MHIGIRPQAGFTLPELITTLGISAILLSLAIPSFQSLAASNRVAAAVNVFLTHLHLARSEAIKRNSKVVLCPSPDGRTCSKDYTQWGKGFIAFADDDDDRTRDADEALISVQQEMDVPVQIMTSSKYRRTIGYHPSGMAWGNNTTVRFCIENQPAANRAIIISSPGRPRVSEVLVDGKSVRCDATH